MLGETKNQFSLTRVAFSTCGRPKSKFLEKSPQEVLDGLLERRNRHLQFPLCASDPGFGCWDEKVTTEYRHGQWVLVSRDRALENVRREMAGMVKIYEKLMVKRDGQPASQTHTFTWRERQLAEGRKGLYDAIRQALGL